MSIKSIVTTGVGINNGQRDIPTAQPPQPVYSSSAYVRPTDWPTLPTMTSSDSKLIGLVAVTNDSSNYLAINLTLSAGASASGGHISNGAVGVAGTIFTPGNVSVTYLVGQVLSGTGVTAGTKITSQNSATFAGSTSGTTLTISSVSSGTIGLGMYMSGGTIGNGFRIVAFVSGTLGGPGVYTLSSSAGTSTCTTGTSFNVNTSQLVSNQIITGTNQYSVDWGDGVTDLWNSGVQANHQYNYTTLGTSVTTAGYKTAIVQATPVSGNLTGITIQVKFPNNPSLPTVPAKWLDLSFGSPNCTSLSIGSSGPTVSLPFLQQARLYSVASSYLTAAASLFAFCTSLQSVPVLNLAPAYTSLNGTFNACLSLRISPTLPASSAATVDCTNMFASCSALDQFPTGAFAGITTNNIGSMFQNCTNLKTAPSLITSATISSANSMFSGCVSLSAVPTISGAIVNASSMFSGCVSLKTAPWLNLGSLTDATSMFGSCTSLTTIPSYTIGTSACTYGTMFNGCSSLQTVPKLTLNGTTFSSLFFNCVSLTTIGILTMPNATNVQNMFNGCRSLRNAPTIVNSGTITNMTGMFANCSGLISVPTYTTTNVTTMSTMFSTCSSLVNVPIFDTGNVTDMNNMFQSCPSLITCPAFNTIKVTTMTNMFNGCSSLQDVLFTNTSNVSNVASMFFSCNNFTGSSTWSSWDLSKNVGLGQMFQSQNGVITIPTWNTSNVTNINNMCAFSTTMTIIPALNFSNVTTATTPFNSPAITKIQATGLKVSTSLVGTQLVKSALEEVFTNLGSNTTVQTITITSVPGATTALSKTSGITAGSNVVTMANTVGVITGTYLYGTGVNTGIPVTFDATADTVVYTNGGGVNGLANGDNVMFTAITTTTGIVINTPYFVVNRTGTTFQISTTSGGAAINLVTNGTGVMSIGGATISNQIVTVNANANVIISGVSGITNAAATLTNRALNQNYATTKNWTVTG